jgi:hypothetical protein
MRIKITTLCFAAVMALQSCGDEHQYLPQVAAVEEGNPKIKFIHAASDTVGVNLYLDGSKITGSLPSTISTVGAANFGKVNIGTVTFQNAFPVTDYFAAPNSSGNFSVVFPESYNATSTFPTKTLSTASGQTLNPASFYTVAFVGVSPAYETITYEDDLSKAPIDGQAYIRFANFIGNAPANLTLRATPPAVPNVDPTPAAINLFTNVAYKGMTGFIALPRTGAYTNVQIVDSTSGVVIATLAAVNSTFINNKVYTVFARGRIGVVGTAAPGVTRVVNR